MPAAGGVCARHTEHDLQRMRGVALFALVAVASLQPVPSEAPVGSRVVPCERRSAVASGRRLASFARFATVDTDPHANAADGAVIDACDLSRELLVRLLREEDIDRLIAPLPPKFFHNRSAVSEECAQIAGVGKKIAAGLVEYQADCFRILHGGANCSLKLQLGGIWDDLLDTPFDWTGKGLQSCKDYSAAFGDYTVDSTYKCSFCSDANGTQPTACASPALVRLSVCASEAWWPEAAAAAYEAISMCQSSASCASLCYGYTSWNTTRREAAKNKLPTLGAGGAPSRAKASLIDALVLVKRYLLPIGDVVDVCVADQNCPDKSLVTTVNVTTNVCDVSCPAYAQTMQKLTSAADLLLPAEYGATLESFCPKVELGKTALLDAHVLQCIRPACSPLHCTCIARARALALTNQHGIPNRFVVSGGNAALRGHVLAPCVLGLVRSTSRAPIRSLSAGLPERANRAHAKRVS